jgi:uncharacterized protein (TIGR00297 family)
MQLGAAFILAAAISAAALATRNLDLRGTVAATAVGTVVLGFGGWQCAAVLLAFFASSSLLGRAVRAAGRQPTGKYAKGGQRDAGQVLGNGVVAAAVAVLFHTFPHSSWPWLAFAGSVAAVNADTWATELGVLAPDRPHLITHLSKTVAKGTSGAISPLGTAAAGAGAALISALALLWAPNARAAVWWPPFLGGIVGALVDSYLGATVQVSYTCSKDGAETEQHPVHECGSPTFHRRGWRWLNNDGVNLACAIVGAAIATLASLAY